jgi:RimJ/RimL family protein N-acetyltransferase
MGFVQPATLAGRHVKLEPLAMQHLEGLQDAVRDGELWKLWYTVIPSPDDMEKEIGRRLDLQERGSMLPFTVRRQDTGAICGMTTYMNIDGVHRRVEIGSTWYAQSVQRTALNTEAKLLLLTHAFDELRCIAVEFRTHWMNHASRAAIARLGAKQDGVLRNHQRMADGSYRDTVVFSIIDAEWPTVRRHLQYKLEDVSC